MHIYKLICMWIVHVGAAVFLIKLSYEDSYQLWSAHRLLADVHAANECVQTAQLKEGGRGEDCTINSHARSELKHMSGTPIETHWLVLYAHALSTICLVSKPCLPSKKKIMMRSDHDSEKILPHKKYLLPYPHTWKWSYSYYQGTQNSIRTLFVIS